jgi:hypothetical protein
MVLARLCSATARNKIIQRSHMHDMITRITNALRDAKERVAEPRAM